MGNNTTWDVYLKTRELCDSLQQNTPQPISLIAQGLAIDNDIAVECAILLHNLGLVEFDGEKNEIMLPRIPH